MLRWQCCTLVLIGSFATIESPKAKPTPIPDAYVKFFEQQDRYRHNRLNDVKFKAVEEKSAINKKMERVSPSNSNLSKKQLEQVNEYKVLIKEIDDRVAKEMIRTKDIEWGRVSERNPPTAVGEIGMAQFNVFQRLGDSRALMRIRHTSDGNTNLIGYVTGLPMKNVVDGQDVSPILVQAIGTHTYATNFGPKTILKYEPVDKQAIADAYKLWVEPIIKAEELVRKHDEEALAKNREAAEQNAKQAASLKATADREKKAVEALTGAKFSYENGNTEKAKDKLKAVIKDFAGTKAAKEAEALLAKW